MPETAQKKVPLTAEVIVVTKVQVHRNEVTAVKRKLTFLDGLLVGNDEAGFTTEKVAAVAQ